MTDGEGATDLGNGEMLIGPVASVGETTVWELLA